MEDHGDGDSDEESGAELGEYEQKLLNKFQKYLHSSDDETYSENDEEIGAPSDKSWGRNKKMYYSTDFIDDEMGG